MVTINSAILIALILINIIMLNKRPHNNNNKPHGLWKVYYPNTNYLWYTAYLVNGEFYGMSLYVKPNLNIKLYTAR
jgi:hypothetical protein